MTDTAKPFEPDANTSNYGWAIWHASQACRVGGLDAIAEAQLATARAILAHADLLRELS